MTSTYTVSVASFEGPFDLLLHLISRRKVDIYEIPLAQITDDYITVLRQMEVLDLEVATDFLVVAATLIELKAARLLPGEDDPELDELALEARDLLYARLLDYRTFKEVAGFVGERLAGHQGYVPRAVPLEPAFTGLLPQVRLELSAADLALLAARALAEQPDQIVDTSHLPPVRMTVRDAAGMLVAQLQRAGGRANFAELTAGCRHRIEVVVHFLALLELYKLDQVDIDQSARCGAIDVALNADADWLGSVFGAMQTYEATDRDDAPTDAEGAA
ncbi:segregation/condensation protein A [soil metagenome]|jgi:segregation and condensation protein A